MASFLIIYLNNIKGQLRQEKFGSAAIAQLSQNQEQMLHIKL
ncbi:hypothetical protein CCACVL1_24114 [Corchorus capsularis]|uniref:Uncharacterized protein n=1 Tax=Corchorus capsularis TaxID=210143 RepID=A0A1R3GQZ2_COCAP|nr:hypothetical protein CCACVL1_24114 [Corchorus capsularis]